MRTPSWKKCDGYPPVSLCQGSSSTNPQLAYPGGAAHSSEARPAHPGVFPRLWNLKPQYSFV